MSLTFVFRVSFPYRLQWERHCTIYGRRKSCFSGFSFFLNVLYSIVLNYTILYWCADHTVYNIILRIKCRRKISPTVWRKRARTNATLTTHCVYIRLMVGGAARGVRVFVSLARLSPSLTNNIPLRYHNAIVCTNNREQLCNSSSQSIILYYNIFTSFGLNIKPLVLSSRIWWNMIIKIIIIIITINTTFE